MGSASIITRFNDYPAITIQGAPANGYSSGDAIKALEEIAADTLGEGYAYEWSGMSREEIEAGNKTVYVFALAILFVFLVLAASMKAGRFPLPYCSVCRPVSLGQRLCLPPEPAEQHLLPDRYPGRHRLGCQERHPDHRIRQSPCR